MLQGDVFRADMEEEEGEITRREREEASRRTRDKEEEHVVL